MIGSEESGSAWDRRKLLTECEAEVGQLPVQNISEMTPSRRDFAQYVTTQRRELASVVHLSRGPLPSAIELAQSCDDAEVAALSIAAMDELGSLPTLAAISSAVSAPTLRSGFVIDPNQLYALRLHGADAALFPTRDLGADRLRELVSVASSLHMASITEVNDAPALEVALQLPRVLIGIACVATDGSIDCETTRLLAARVPAGRTIIALPQLRSVEQGDRLRGVVDAVVLSQSLTLTKDPSTLIARIGTGGG